MSQKWGFFENIDEFRDFSKFRQKRVFWKIWAQIDILKFRPKSRFPHISTKIEILAKLDQNRDFLQISTKIEGVQKIRLI